MRKLTLLLLLFAGLCRGEEMLRRVSVPQEVLPLLLEQGADRMLILSRAYEELWTRVQAARKQAPVKLPAHPQPLQVDVTATLRDEWVELQAECVVQGLTAGWNVVELPFENALWTSAQLENQPVEMAGTPGGTLQVFFEGEGPFVLQLRGVSGLTLNQNRQHLRFRVPEVPGRVSLDIPSGTETGGLVLLASEEKNDSQRLQVNPAEGWIDASFSLDRLYRANPLQMTERLVQETRLSEELQEISVTSSVFVNHQPVEGLRYLLPAGLTVRSLQSQPAADWETLQEGEARYIRLQFPEEVIGNVQVNFQLIAERVSQAEWTSAEIRLENAERSWQYHGVSVPERIQVSDLDSRGAVAVPPAAASAGKDEIRFAWIRVWDGEPFPPAPFVAFREREGSVEGFATLMLSINDLGQDLQGRVTLLPKGRGLFQSAFTLPEAWHLSEVVLGDGRALPFEKFSLEDGSRIVRVDFPEKVHANRPVSYRFTASATPGGWLDAEAERQVVFPAFRLPGVDRLTGALAAHVAEGNRLQVDELRELTPLDDRTRALLNFVTADRVPGYRFEGGDYGLAMTVEPLQPEVRVEAYSFFTIESSRMQLNYEWKIANSRAPLRAFTFTLPVTLPRGVTPVLKGFPLRGEVMREALAGGGERWTLPLSANPGDQVHLSLSSELPSATGETLRLPLPGHPGIELQSGFFAVEGATALRVLLENAPHEVDLGELSGAGYRPGPRLMGCFAYSGPPPVTTLKTEVRDLLDLPETLLRSLQLDTRISVTGEAQTQALFTLEEAPAFLALRLPEEAVCWSAEVNDSAVEPRRGPRGEWLIPVTGTNARGLQTVRVVYSSKVLPPAAGNRQQLPAPRLSVYSEERETAPLAPVETRWTLSPPEGVQLTDSRGTAILDRPLRQRLAAVEGVKLLGTLAGGVRTPMDWYDSIFGRALESSMRRRGYKDSALEEAAEMADVQAELYGGATEQLGGDSARATYESSADMMRDSGTPLEPQSRSKFKGGASGKMEGYRSLKIRLESGAGGIGFHSLNPAPALDISLRKHKGTFFLSLAVGLLVFAGGAGLLGFPRRKRVIYVFGAVLVSTLPGVLPFLTTWTPVFNAVFISACLLTAFYIGCLIAGKLWRPFRRPVLVLTAFLLSLGAKAAETLPPLPLPVPEEVIVEIRPSPGPAEAQLLVPRAHLENLQREQAKIDAENQEAPEGISWLGGEISTRLSEDSHLNWQGRLRLRIRGEGPRAVLFAVTHADLEEVKANGKVARLRSRAGQTEILFDQAGVYDLSFRLRTEVKRNAGVRYVSFRIPALPGVRTRVAAPEKDVRMEIHGDKLDRTRIAESAEDELTAPLEANGHVFVRWLPHEKKEPAGSALQVRSLQVLDLQNDCAILVDDLNISVSGTPLAQLQVEVPADWNLHAVEGEIVSGWEQEKDQVTVHFLREVDTPAKLRFTLWKNRAEDSALPVPALPVRNALRQTETVVLRAVKSLEVNVLEHTQLQRAEIPPALPDPADIAGLQAAEDLVPFHSYLAHTADYRIVLQTQVPERKIQTRWQALLRMAPQGDVVEALCAMDWEGAPLFRVSFTLPADMEVTRVQAPGVEDWSVENGTLTLFAPGGVAPGSHVVLEGRFPPSRADTRQLPRLHLEGAAGREGQWVLLTDPSVELESTGSSEMKRIPLAATLDWLSSAQWPFARLAFSFEGDAASPDLKRIRLSPEVTVRTFSNVRINHQVIEETLLLDARIQRAGLREFRFRVPARFRDARVKAPLMREIRMQPVADQPDWVEMTVVLQDEVMDQLVILLESDRGAEAEVLTLHPPEVLTGETQGVFVTVENAGRDEVRPTGFSGLELLNRGHAEWKEVTGMLGENVTFAYLGRKGGPQTGLELKRIARKQAETAGGRIGLSRVELQMDGEGAYLGKWTAWIDNRTEQALRAALPEGARLVGVTVAGEEVAVLSDGETDGNTIRIPLVKTPLGERDIELQLVYAGTLESFRDLQRNGFPFPESLNLPVDLSQATLYLPRTRRWMRFDGSMRQVADAAQYEQGWLRYQTGLTERLTQTLRTGDLFSQARATHSISQLKSDLKNNRSSGKSKEVDEGWFQADQALKKAEKELKRADVNDVGNELSDNRISFNSLYESQSNSFSRNQVLLNGSNFEPAPQMENDIEVNLDQQAYGNMQQVLQAGERQVNAPASPVVMKGNLVPRGGRKRQAAQYLEDLDRSELRQQGEAAVVSLLHYPMPDLSKSQVYRFTTPRGDMRVTVRSVSGQLLQALSRAAAFLLLLLLLLAVAKGHSVKGLPPGQRGTLLLFLGLISLCVGFFPVAAIVAMVWGAVLKMQSSSKAPVDPRRALPY